MSRRLIIAWYDTDRVCYLSIAFAAWVLLFSLSGVWTVLGNPTYRDYLWLPILLACLSTAVLLSTALRLVHRRRQRMQH